MSTAILTDSGCDLTSETLEKHGVYMMYSNIHLGTNIYTDRLEIDAAGVLDQLEQSHISVSTTPPSPSDFANKFRELLKKYETVLYISVSKEMSPINDHAQQAAPFFGEQIKVIDSHTATTGLGLRVLRAAQLAQRGLDMDGIVDELHRIDEYSGVWFTVDTLRYLKMTGRISPATAFFGGLMRVKPIMKIQQGHVHPIKRSFGQTQALTTLEHSLRNELESRIMPRIAFIYSPGGEEKLKFLRSTAYEFDFQDMGDHPIGSTVAASTGPNTVGFCIEPE